MSPRNLVVLVVGVLALACHRQLLGGNTAVSGDDPSVNQMTSARQKQVPFCPGGDRAKGCLLGQSCRITPKGCQVCQCQTPD